MKPFATPFLHPVRIPLVIILTVWLVGILGAPAHLCAQTASLSIQRARWVTQSLSNSIPLSYRFEGKAIGNGFQSVLLASPASTNALAGSSVQMAVSATCPVATVTNGVTVSGLTSLNASYPVGAYKFTVQSAVTNAITKKVTLSTNATSLTLGNDFANVDPLITNVAPFSPIGTSQTLQWRAWTNAATGAFAAFYLFEGRFDSNTLSAAASGGTSVLTNFTLLSSYPKLALSQTSVQITNASSTLDHLALLEFHAPTDNPSTLPALQAESTVLNLVIYLAAVTNSTSTNGALTIQPTSTNTVVVTWSTNATSSAVLSSSGLTGSGGKPLSKTSLASGAACEPSPIDGRVYCLGGAWERVTEPVTLNRDGRFQVIVPARMPRQFFQLELPLALAGTHWTPTMLEGSAVALIPAPAVHFSLAQVSGFAGANSFSASIQSLEPGLLRVGSIAATRKLGPPEAMAVENALFRILPLVDHYQTFQGTLELFQDATLLGRFKQISADAE